MTAAAAYMPAQHPHNQADAAGVPAIPAIPLILLDAMAALGWTVEMALAAYRAAMGSQRAESLESQESPRQSQESRSEPVKSIDRKERKRLRDRINIANKRAAARAGDNRATPCDSAGSLSLSLKDNPGFSREREKKSRAESPLSRNTGDSAGLMALPSDWQPNETGWKLAVAELGEIAAANCLAKFRDHYEAGSGPLRTARQWQALFRKWVRNERNFMTSPQHNLPLVRQFTGGQNYGRKSLAAVADELIARADERKLRGASPTGPPGDGIVAAG